VTSFGGNVPKKLPKKGREISKIQDGGGRNLEKSKNRHISAVV